MLHQVLEQCELNNSIIGAGNKYTTQVLAQTTEVTLSANGPETVIINSTATDIDVLLPPEVAGIRRTIVNAGTTAILTVKEDSDTTTYATVGPGESVTLFSNGTVWYRQNIPTAQSQTAVAAGGTKTLTGADAGKLILLDTAAGSVVTLPAATGTGRTFRFEVSVLATAAAHIIKVANTTDVMKGLAFGTRVDSGNAVLGFATAADTDTITLNRTTTGSVSIGERINVIDRASGIFNVQCFLSATGAAFATPFSTSV